MENNLLIYRKRAKMRQFDLATRLGITEQAISGYETGRTKLSVDRAVEIAGVLGVEPKDVFPSLFQ